MIYGDPDSRWMLNQVLLPAYDVIAVPYFPTVIAGVFAPTKPDLVVLDIGLAGEPVPDFLPGQERVEECSTFCVGCWSVGRPDSQL